jgi:hypothetical protein
VSADGTSCDVFVGDFDGDHYADFANHDPSINGIGAFQIYRNQHDGTFGTVPFSTGTTCTVEVPTGSPCEVLVADVTADGYADFAERERSSGKLFIHSNLRDGASHASTRIGPSCPPAEMRRATRFSPTSPAMDLRTSRSTRGQPVKSAFARLSTTRRGP